MKIGSITNKALKEREAKENLKNAIREFGEKISINGHINSKDKDFDKEQKAYKKIEKAISSEPFKADKVVKEVKQLVNRNKFGQERDAAGRPKRVPKKDQKQWMNENVDKILEAVSKHLKVQKGMKGKAEGMTGAKALKHQAKTEYSKTIAGRMKERFQQSAVGRTVGNIKNAISPKKTKELQESRKNAKG